MSRDRNQNFLRTWQTINENMPDEVRRPVRSHVSASPAKLVRNDLLQRIDTPINESEPLSDSNLSKFVLNRLPAVKKAGDLFTLENIEAGPVKAINWFSTPEKARESAAQLMKLVEGSKLSTEQKRRAKLYYENFPNAFAHEGGFAERKLPGAIRGQRLTASRRAYDHLDQRNVLDEAGNPRFNPEGKELKVWKLKPESEKLLLQHPEKRFEILNNLMELDKKKLNTPVERTSPGTLFRSQAEIEGEGTVRHEGGHLGQFIRDPVNYGKKYEQGTGQIRATKDSPVNLKHLDYSLNPREVSVRMGQDKGLDKKRRFSDFKINPETKEVKITPTRLKGKTPADEINSEFARVLRELNAAKERAPTVPQFAHAVGRTRFRGIGKPKVIQVNRTKDNISKAEPKILSRTVDKIHDTTLPYFGKEDPLVLTFMGKEVPNVKAWTANPAKYGEYLKQLVAMRRSKIKR